MSIGKLLEQLGFTPEPAAQPDKDAAFARLQAAGYTDDDMCKLSCAIHLTNNAAVVYEKVIKILIHLGSHHGALKTVEVAQALDEQMCIAEKVVVKAQIVAEHDLGVMYKPDIASSEHLSAEIEKIRREVAEKQPKEKDESHVVH